MCSQAHVFVLLAGMCTSDDSSALSEQFIHAVMPVLTATSPVTKMAMLVS